MYNAPFSDSEALRPNYSAHAGCYSLIQKLCLCWPSDWTLPAPGIYYSHHLSSRRDDL